MLFLSDPNFDYNDQLAKKYLKYQDVYYDVGTKVKLHTPSGIKDAIFIGWRCDGKSFKTIEYVNLLGVKYIYSCANAFVTEIIDPVYPKFELPTHTIIKRECPPSWDVEIGWIWYIIIMIVGFIFKDGWMIWFFATAVFFLWKNGFLNGGKK